MEQTTSVIHQIPNFQIDYQLSVKNSPAVDLHYFFSTSLADELRSKIDYLLDYYYGHLLAELTELNNNLSGIPTRQEFLADFEKRAYYGMSLLIVSSLIINIAIIAT